MGNAKTINSKLSDDKTINFNKQNKLDDYELNNLDYLEAKEKDKRSLVSIYWSMIKREHRKIFTFF